MNDYNLISFFLLSNYKLVFYYNINKILLKKIFILIKIKVI